MKSTTMTRKSNQNVVRFASSTKMGSETSTSSNSLQVSSGHNHGHRHYQHQHHRNNTSNHNSNNSGNGRQLPQYLHDNDVDMEYCKEISRRAVARAALHLGVEEMSGDSLCVLGDVLVSYLERIGKVMSSTVEASSRSSAHCNVFDALHAVEACTPPAASQLHLRKPSPGDDGDVRHLMAPANHKTNSHGGGLGSPWEGLASFLFGDDWCDGDELHRARNPTLSRHAGVHVGAAGASSSARTSVSGGDGGVGGGGTAVDGASAATNTNSGDGDGGWNVPHYDTIEPFPQRSVRRKRIVFHELGKEEEACRGGMTTGALATAQDAGTENVGTKVNSDGAGGPRQPDAAEKSDGKDVANVSKGAKESSSSSTATRMNAIAEGAEKYAELQANEIPDWNYRNGITSFWGSVASISSSSSRQENAGGLSGTVDTGATNTAMDIDGVAGKTKDVAAGGKEDVGTGGAGSKRKNDANAKSGGIQKRAKTTDTSDSDAGKDACPSNDGTDALQIMSKRRGSRPIYVPPFLPPFPPEHTYNPSTSIVLSVSSSNAQSSSTAGTGDVASNGGLAALSTSVMAANSVTEGADINQGLDERGTKSVRESLVTLGRYSFWGSTMPKRSANEQGPATPAIHVQTSMPGGASQGRIKNNLVTPLESKSTWKSSRILEGSF